MGGRSGGMGMTRLLPALLCLGCSTYYAKPDDSMARSCAIAPFANIESPDRAISCANLSVNISVARDLMIQHGYLRGGQEFAALYSDVSITLHNERCLAGGIGNCEFGQYSENTEFERTSHVIDLDHDAVSLGHELMHHYDMDRIGRAADLSEAHDHWTQLGYFSYAADYQRMALPVMQ